MKVNTYIVATIKDWHIKEFVNYSKKLSGNWHLITNKNKLTTKNIKQIKPKYIFFPHWSWLVSKEITNNYNCVCFHETDLPYGRGGSPIQNLILNGHKKTKITAFKMTQELDAGDIYTKVSLSLSGSAQEIFVRSSKIIANMIKTIVEQNPTPKTQTGKITNFNRRTPQQSVIPNNISLNKIYDFIRMLDADTYPKSYINYGNFRITFDNSKKSGTTICANVKITILNNE